MMVITRQMKQPLPPIPPPRSGEGGVGVSFSPSPLRGGGRGVGFFRHRRAFTIVELMVALALIIFIMTIIAAAFGSAGKTYRDLKAAGDLAEQLRSALNLLRRDLASP